MLRIPTLSLNNGTDLDPAPDSSSSDPKSSDEPISIQNASVTRRAQIPALLLEELLPDRPDAPPLAGFRVLVVDDEPDACKLVSFALNRKGAAVETACSVKEALLKIEDSATIPFDVLVSDVGMPDENGYTLIRRIRAHESQTGHFLPAIALTAYAFSEDRVRALLAGFQAHMAKPVEPEELIELVASLKGYKE